NHRRVVTEEQAPQGGNHGKADNKIRIGLHHESVPPFVSSRRPAFLFPARAPDILAVSRRGATAGSTCARYWPSNRLQGRNVFGLSAIPRLSNIHVRCTAAHRRR